MLFEGHFSLCCHSASNISESIYDTSTETEIANNKSHESLQVTLALFEGH